MSAVETLSTEDRALMARYLDIKDAYESIIEKAGPSHVPGTPWPRSVTRLEAELDAMKEAAGQGVPGDSLCCQRYGKLHHPVFALSSCRWYPLRAQGASS